MTPEDYSNYLAIQNEELQLDERCCEDLTELTSVSLVTPRQLKISSDTAVVSFENKPFPTLLFQLDEDSADQLVQVFSFGDRKGGAINLSREMFIQSRYQYFDVTKSPIQPAFVPEVCWGDFDSSSMGIWSRSEIPEGAQYLAISPSLTPPNQLVDTTRDIALPLLTGVLVNAIAEQNKSYLWKVNFGYTGELNVSVIDSNLPPLGRCIRNAAE